MSRTWAGGGSTAWRALRRHVLIRDAYQCQLAYPGICTGVATTGHHVLGARVSGIVCSPDKVVAACSPCNLYVGEPTTDPRPLVAGSADGPAGPSATDLAGVVWHCWRCKASKPAVEFHGRIRGHGCQACHNEVRAEQKRRTRQRAPMLVPIGDPSPKVITRW